MILYVKAKAAEGELREAATAAAMRSFDAMEVAHDARLVALCGLRLNESRSAPHRWYRSTHFSCSATVLLN